MLSLWNNAYAYAQSLDNSGDTEYWMKRGRAVQPERLDMMDRRLPQVRGQIDRTMGRWGCTIFKGVDLELRATPFGNAVVTIVPESLDASGRGAPVLVVVNIFSRPRGEAAAFLRAIPTFMHRTIAPSSGADIDQVEHLLSSSRLSLFFILIVSFIRSKN